MDSFEKDNLSAVVGRSDRLLTAGELIGFVRALSHNLRDSLGLVNAFADLAAAHEQAADEDLQRLLSTVQRNGRLALHVIDQLHTVAHAYIGTPLQADTFDLLSVIVAVQQNLSLYAPHLQMDLVLDEWYPPVTAAPVWVEEAMFGIVWFFGRMQRESFQIKVSCEQVSDGRATVAVQGPAVSSAVETQIKVGRPVDDIREVGLDGYGMPLHVVRLLLQRMGGDLYVRPAAEDDPGRLTLVCLLPSRPSEATSV